MKIFVYNGSPRGTKSLGYQFIKKVEEKMIHKGVEVEFSIYQSKDLKIKFSDGQVKDFLTGKTSFNDDMEKLENAMIDSDFIILVSPVYAHNVSAQMKIFIDRLSYWLHIYRLIGKCGLAVSVSSDNGNEIVNSYLEEMMGYLGIYVIGTVGIKGASIKDKEDIFDSYAEVWAKRIILSQYENIEVPETQEQNFRFQQEKYMKLEYATAEKEYWQKNGMFEFQNFSEFFEMNRVKSNV